MRVVTRALNAVAGVVLREPAMVVAAIDATLMVAIALGAPLSAEQKATIDGFLAVVSGLIVRSQVSPVNAPTDSGTGQG